MTKLLNIKSDVSNWNYSEDISIVMAVYNHEETVAEAIESALMQEMPYKSVIHCLNDASTDKSAEILDNYRRKYPDKIKVYSSSENQGSGKKSFYHNKPSVIGRYWCLLAGDDYWTTTDKLSKQISFLDGNKEYTGCSCNTLMKNEVTGEESIIKPDRNNWNLYDMILLRNKYAFYVHTSSIVWRNIFIENGFFLPPKFKRSKFFGDVILMHMMLSQGGKMLNLPQVMSCYRVTGHGVWTKMPEDVQIEMNRKLMKKIDCSIPITYQIFIRLQSIRRFSQNLKTIIPGPINE